MCWAAAAELDGGLCGSSGQLCSAVMAGDTGRTGEYTSCNMQAATLVLQLTLGLSPFRTREKLCLQHRVVFAGLQALSAEGRQSQSQCRTIQAEVCLSCYIASVEDLLFLACQLQWLCKATFCVSCIKQLLAWD